jgi:thiamine biosynthesis protein ThiS
VNITLNGEPFELAGPLTVSDLLAQLDIDARRVAVERNLVVLKRAVFDSTRIGEGDQIEVVNFVGGGAPAAMPSRRCRCSAGL